MAASMMRTAQHMVADSRRRTGIRQTMRSAMAAAWLPSESNKGVSESLSALEGKSTRVRRESPSKTPKNGSQMVHSPIALVGAIGEACGEAPRVSVSGTPPFSVVCLPLILRTVIIRHSLTGFIH